MTVGPTRLAMEQINMVAEDKEEGEYPAFSVITWKKKAPISRRMLKEGEELEVGLLEQNVDSLGFDT